MGREKRPWLEGASPHSEEVTEGSSPRERGISVGGRTWQVRGSLEREGTP